MRGDEGRGDDLKEKGGRLEGGRRRDFLAVSCAGCRWCGGRREGKTREATKERRGLKRK